MSKPTPGPWVVVTDEDGSCIMAGKHYVVEAIGDADARLIVRAVNSHDDLLNTCNRLIAKIVSDNGEDVTCDHDAGICNCALFELLLDAYAAIAKATKEPQP